MPYKSPTAFLGLHLESASWVPSPHALQELCRVCSQISVSTDTWQGFVSHLACEFFLAIVIFLGPSDDLVIPESFGQLALLWLSDYYIFRMTLGNI